MRSLLRAVATVATVVAATALVATASYAAQATLSCPATAQAGQQFTIEIAIDVGTTPLGAYSIAVTYDPAVLTLAAVTGGNTAEFSGKPTTTTTSSTSSTTTTSSTSTSTTTTTSPTRCGDVNGDGVVNVGDALLVAQYDVGLRQCGVAPFIHPEVCDVNNDGNCNIGDALRIAQCDVGLISCTFTCRPFTCP